MSNQSNVNLMYQIAGTMGSRDINKANPTLITVAGWDLMFQKMYSKKHIMEERALAVMLLTGCRVSELRTIKIRRIRNETLIDIECGKQHKTRFLHLYGDSVLLELLPVTYPYANMEVSQKQVARYMRKNYPEIIPGRDFTGHNACHIMRYIYIAILAECFDMEYEQITSIMQWSDIELVDIYLKYLLYMTNSVFKKFLTPKQILAELLHD